MVEVVVSMLLLSIAILTSLTILATGMLANDISRDKSVALSLAEQEIEYWKQVPGEQLTGDTLTNDSLKKYTTRLDGKQANDPSTLKAGYLEVMVTSTPYQSNTNLVRITVEVSRHYPNRKAEKEVPIVKLAVVRRT
jgi:Tfp pilus assembly protein PilV